RKYNPRGVWLASALSLSTFWIYMKAAMVAIFRLKRGFAVTPKSVGGAIPLRRLAVELTLFGGNCATSLWCVYHLALTRGNIAYAVTAAWATYHGVLLSTRFFHLKQP